ncbi:DNA-directed RNA polymerase sigma-70 factor [Fulvitalea axinellae]|uniref:DNA-directed RNA polymerase sigma-70 factor n=1 Tax=Fulvitalea axinellae TaxID=1182444 RepID=A0AAU9CEM2_9BACT|nr:DNA-directed RNA polymerase sigma-70 factor [Fulvitalea axinellae]
MSLQEETFLKEIHKHQALIQRICHIYRDNAEDREDLFQEMIYQLWKSYPKFESRSKISSWMYRICLNTAIVTFRKPRLITTEIGSVPEPATETHDDSDREALYSAIRKLNDSEKAIITLYLDDVDNTEMASIIGISKNNLSVRLNRIKNKIRTLVNA